MNKKEREYSGFAVVLGVIIVPRFFRYPYDLASLLARELERLSLAAPQSTFPASNLMLLILGSVLLILIVRFWEGREIKELGLSAPWLRSVLAAIGVWIVFEMSSPMLLSWGRLVTHFALAGKVSELPPFDRQIWTLSAGWFYAIISADVVFEELITRAYLIERMTMFLGSIWIAGAISFLVSLALHVPGRNFYEALLRAPLILVLVAMYMYSRSLIACSLLHFLVNASWLSV